MFPTMCLKEMAQPKRLDGADNTQISNCLLSQVRSMWATKNTSNIHAVGNVSNI